MTFIIMHRTSPRWEAGEIPSRDQIQRVGALIGDLQKEDRLLAGDGLRASSEGVRLSFAGGARTITPGPFTGGNELPAAFSVVRTASMDEAIEFATREAAIAGDCEIDIRPVTEPWEIGLGEPPAHASSRRYMVLRKATPATEGGIEPTPPQRRALLKLIDDSTKAGVHLARVEMKPSSRGRRYVNSAKGVVMFDGPFVETKELLAGFIIISAESLDAAGRWAERYIEVVEAPEVDVRELTTSA
jgi:hypothetical protein